MEKIRLNNSKLNSFIGNNKIDGSIQNIKHNANSPGTVTKKRGVYVEKFLADGMEPKLMEEVPQGSKKKLIESVLKTLTKSSKASQFPDKKNARKHNIVKLKNNENAQQFIKQNDQDIEKTPIIVLKPNTIKNKTTQNSIYAAGKSPLARTKNPADIILPAKAIQKTALTKITENKTNVPQSKIGKKTAPITISATTAGNKPNKARRGKRLLPRKASPDNTLISEKIIIKETPKNTLSHIESKSGDNISDDEDRDTKIYSLIKDFLESTINTCSDNLRDNYDSKFHIDEEIVTKLMIKNDDDSHYSLSNCADSIDSSSVTIKKRIESISWIPAKLQANRNVGTYGIADVKIQKEEKFKTQKNSNPIIIVNKTNSLGPPKQKAPRKSVPVPKFVNQSVVQHIYNIQLDSNTLKTKKYKLIKHLKNPSQFSKHPSFFETLSLILKNKNKALTFK